MSDNCQGRICSAGVAILTYCCPIMPLTGPSYATLSAEMLFNVYSIYGTSSLRCVGSYRLAKNMHMLLFVLLAAQLPSLLLLLLLLLLLFWGLFVCLFVRLCVRSVGWLPSTNYVWMRTGYWILVVNLFVYVVACVRSACCSCCRFCLNVIKRYTNMSQVLLTSAGLGLCFHI